VPSRCGRGTAAGGTVCALSREQRSDHRVVPRWVGRWNYLVPLVEARFVGSTAAALVREASGKGLRAQEVAEDLAERRERCVQQARHLQHGAEDGGGERRLPPVQRVGVPVVGERIPQCHDPVGDGAVRYVDRAEA
jgi:hypothetical protein